MFVKKPIDITGAITSQRLTGSGQYLGADRVNMFYADGMNMFPAVTEWLDLSNFGSIDGLYWWKKQGILVVVNGGKIYTVSSKTSPAKVDVTSSDAPVIGTLATFAEYGDQLFICNGTKPLVLQNGASVVTNGGSVYTCIKHHVAGSDDDEPGSGANWTTYWALGGVSQGSWATSTYYGSGKAEALTDIDSDVPSTVSWCYTQEGYLMLMADDTKLVHFNPSPSDVWTWDNSFFTANVKQSPTTAMVGDSQEILVASKECVETWYNDIASPWTRNPSATVFEGVIAPRSLLVAESRRFYINTNRQWVEIQGRFPVEVSDTLSSYIDSIETVEDCEAHYVISDGDGFIILKFESADECLCVPIKDPANWFRLSDYANGDYVGFKRFNCTTYCEDWGITLVGDADKSIIYQLDPTSEMSGSETWRGMFRTKPIDYNTGSRKRSRKLVIKCVRTKNLPDNTSGSVSIRWRDDGNPQWSNPRTIDLKSVETQTVQFDKTIAGLGSYISRQYECVCTVQGLSVAGFEEEVELLNV